MKALATEPDDLSLSPRTHMLAGESPPSGCSMTSAHTAEDSKDMNKQRKALLELTSLRLLTSTGTTPKESSIKQNDLAAPHSQFLVI